MRSPGRRRSTSGSRYSRPAAARAASQHRLLPRLLASRLTDGTHRASIAAAMAKGEKRCWPGYEPVPGKEPHEQGSCRKTARSKLTPTGKRVRAARKRQIDRWQEEHPHTRRSASQGLPGPKARPKKKRATTAKKRRAAPKRAAKRPTKRPSPAPRPRKKSAKATARRAPRAPKAGSARRKRAAQG